ncbi:adhesion G protein-coupled receptor L2-like [Dendronephthya gigantea]|uniref:adhesion G protein-coupled receptor L2-like n=1 Tax=Dendronephthya gigantea TaxID=151771 RepID=UPI00106C5351|nr:adhesion G protein-coupled receptor L2-like [Dendronephthya gigantea]
MIYRSRRHISSDLAWSVNCISVSSLRMAKRLNFGVVYLTLTCCLVLKESSLGGLLDEDCVKRYSASYKRNASQAGSQNKDHYRAAHAVDGKEETCSKSPKTNDNNPWWQVDLDKKMNITFIQVKNSGRTSTLLRVYIRYNPGDGGQICGNRHLLSANETKIIKCEPRFGQSVKIVELKNKYLSLCEVHVFSNTVKMNEGVICDVWLNASDHGYNFLNHKQDSHAIISAFEVPNTIFGHYAVRLKTYFNAPQSGSYNFTWFCGIKCTLYITDVDKKLANAVRCGIFSAEYKKNCDSSYQLTKGKVYELQFVSLFSEEEYNSRVGITFPDGAIVSPLNSGIFLSAEAARILAKDPCYQPAGVISPSSPPSKQTEHDTEVVISSAVDRLLHDKTSNESKFQTLDELEKLGFEKAKKLQLGKKAFASYVVQVERFVFAAVSMNLNLRRGFNFPRDLDNFTSFADKGSISFPENAFPPNTGRTSAVFMMFKPLDEMLKQTGSEKNHLADIIVSASMEREIWNDMYKPFTLVFKHNKVSIKGKRHCVYWLENSECRKNVKFGRWSDYRCSLVHQNDTHTTCQCDHLTKFSVLFPVQDGAGEDEMKLELITYVGLSLSSVGCIVTFAVYFILRITKTLKTIVHLNLVLALGLADLVFLLGNLAENNRNACFFLTVLAFYLYLAVFAWMLMEGVHLYFLVIRVFGSDDHRRKKFYYIVGWGAPGIFVSITAGILGYDLMSEKHCWLSAESASIWVFIGPALFVVVVNTLILAAVLRTTMTLLRNDPGHRKEKSAMRTVAMLVPILGTTWVFGVVAFAHKSIVFQYIFAVCNAFQGFFIFILYCLFNTEVRHEYQRRRKTWKTERELDSKRSPQNNSFDL